MRAILINPWKLSLETIDIPQRGDHSAVFSFSLSLCLEPLYGRGVLIGYDRTGKERETRLSVDDVSKLITWYPP